MGISLSLADGGDPRVEAVVADGRAFVKRTRERYDVVIVALGPPTTAQANRLYTVEWFREVNRVLEPGGVFAFRAAGGEFVPLGDQPPAARLPPQHAGRRVSLCDRLPWWRMHFSGLES